MAMVLLSVLLVVVAVLLVVVVGVALLRGEDNGAAGAGDAKGAGDGAGAGQGDGKTRTVRARVVAKPEQCRPGRWQNQNGAGQSGGGQ